MDPSVEYRDIPNHPGYRVGDDGSVWTSWEKNRWFRRTDEWRPMRSHPNIDGHLKVTLRGHITRYVHHLVLEAFVGPCLKGMACLHGPGGPADNKLNNLRWGTFEEGGAGRVRRGTSTKGGRNPAAKLTAAKVRRIRAAKGSAGKIAKRFGIGRSTVTDILRGVSWGHVI